MSALSNYEVTVEEEFYEIEIGSSGAILASSLAKAGRANIPNGTDTITINFSTALSAVADFTPLGTMYNILDSFPQDLEPRVSGFTVNNVTFKLNAPVDTDNYFISWMVVPIVNG